MIAIKKLVVETIDRLKSHEKKIGKSLPFKYQAGEKNGEVVFVRLYDFGSKYYSFKLIDMLLKEPPPINEPEVLVNFDKREVEIHFYVDLNRHWFR